MQLFHPTIPKVHHSSSSLRRSHLAIKLFTPNRLASKSKFAELKLKKARIAHTIRGDYSRCVWSRYLNIEHDDPLHNPSSFECKVFETRFRVPWSFFQSNLLPWTIRRFPLKADAFGRVGIPTEFKLLSVLRILGRGMHFDDVAEYVGCGFKGEALRVFFHAWVRKFSHEQFHEWVHPPNKQEDEIKAAMKPYMEAGVPGAVASVDGVHIRWDACNQSALMRCTGKEKHPTLAFQMACLHTTEIVSCTRAFAGAVNDLTLCRYDSFLQSVHKGTLYKDVSYEVYDLDGIPHEVRGLVFICDNGYHKWRCLQNPSKVPLGDVERKWSKMIESLRKDIECTFGRLKGRFRILKYGMRFHTSDACERVVWT